MEKEKRIKSEYINELNSEYICWRITKKLEEYSRNQTDGLASSHGYIIVEPKGMKYKLYKKIINTGYKYKNLIKKIYWLEKVARKLKAHANSEIYYLTNDEKRNEVSLENLVQYEQIDFIYIAYRTILNREPDSEGLRHFQVLMLDGVPKEVLVYHIYKSREAKKRKILIEGIDRFKWSYYKYQAVRMIKKIPIISWIYMAITLPRTIYKLHQEYGLNNMHQKYKVNDYISQLNHMSDGRYNKAVEMIERYNKELIQEFCLYNKQVSNEVQENRALLTEVLAINAQLLSELSDKEAMMRQISRELARNEDIMKQTLNDIRNNGVALTQVLAEIRNNDTLQQVTNEIKGIRMSHKPVISCANNISVIQLEEFILALPSEEWRMVAYMNFRGQLEPGFTRLFRNTIKEGMVVVDVGANIGIYTLISGNQVGDLGRVYSFEPTPRTFEILKNNIQVNGLLETNRIILNQIAVSDKKGIAKFSVYSNNSGHNTLFPKDEDDYLIDVNTDTLDNILRDEKRIDVVKIDAEGAEPYILRGMKDIIARNPHITIFIEFAPPHITRAGVNINEFIDELYQYGFRIRRIDDVTGDTSIVEKNELITSFSVNLMLTKDTETR